MFIDRSSYNGYTRILLRDSYRINGKNRHHTILNLTDWLEKDIEALEFALKNQKTLGGLVNQKDISLKQGKSIGALHVLNEIAIRIGLPAALGNDREGKLALWQIIARTIDQGSRLSAVRLAETMAVGPILGLDAFSEDCLYQNLDWLCEHQRQIEDRLFQAKYKGHKPKLFLYDVTSSYFEGDQNELAAFGYNRDKKRGKKQIVIGLLCDEEGDPLSVEVFPGNTSDTKTVSSQLQKISERFGGADITLVGDRGMIKGPQIKEMAGKFHYITAITKPQVDKLLTEGTLQMELFDENIAEVETPEGLRYVCRRNPVRAAETALGRSQKIQTVDEFLVKENAYLQLHPHAVLDKAVARVAAKVKKLSLSDIVAISCKDRRLERVIDQEKLYELAIFDGCYAIKTNVPSGQVNAQTIYDRYKDLAKVESAFRTMKTGHLEIRPIFLRKEERTRAHAFVTMLSYKLVRQLSLAWQEVNMTVQEGLNSLQTLCITDVMINGAYKFSVVPEPRDDNRNLYARANIIPLQTVEKKECLAATKVKLQESRKSLKNSKMGKKRSMRK